MNERGVRHRESKGEKRRGSGCAYARKWKEARSKGERKGWTINKVSAWESG